MNMNASPGDDQLSGSQMSGATGNQVTTDQLIADLKTVMQDAEALLRATSSQTGDKIQEIRTHAEQSLTRARARVTELEQEARRRAQEMSDATEVYMRDNPWQSVGIAAGVGLLIGLLLSSRR